MKSLFTDSQSYIERINKLSKDSQVLWGKMSVAQMMAHCEAGLTATLGETPMGKRNLIGYIFGKIAKRKILSDAPFGKNLPTAPELKMVSQKEFEVEKHKLIQTLERFSKAGYEGITEADHPFFGKMTTEEWLSLQSKHLDHHLQQFGV